MNKTIILKSPLAPQNSPNDLQMLSDAPAHHLFCLLPPVPPTQNALPEVLAVVQVESQFKPVKTEIAVNTSLCIVKLKKAYVFGFACRCVWKERSRGSPFSTACREEGKLQVTSFPGLCQNRWDFYLQWNHMRQCNILYKDDVDFEEFLCFVFSFKTLSLEAFQGPGLSVSQWTQTIRG